MSRASRLEAVAVLLVLALSLALRLTDLDVFIASDELKWTCRSLGFREALVSRDWAGTFRVGHPGVITTWLGALALPRSTTAVETCQRTQDASLPARAGEAPQEQTQRLAELGRLLFQGRVGVALFTWLCLIAVWALTRHALSPGVALVGLATLALDPFLLAHSRFLHLDAVVALLSLTSLAGLIAVGLETQPRCRRLLLLLSGGTAGLAMLQKSPSLFLLPFAALMLAFAAFRESTEWRRLIADLALWSLAAALVCVVLWPATWVHPVGTVGRVLAKAVGYAQEGHESGSFFFGRTGDDPGPLFYPVALAFRMTPVSLLGLVAALVAVLRRRSASHTGERRAILILLAFALAFVAFMTTGAKKFDRYLLPALVALDLVAAVGLVWFLTRYRVLDIGYWRNTQYPISNIQPQVILVALVTVLQLAVALPNHPYYLTAYNPLLGGARLARRAILVGWGEGYDRVAAYLNALPGARQTQATVRGMSNFAPLFVGETRSVAGYRAWQSDYVIFYVSNVQRQHNQDLLERYFFNPGLKPEHMVRLAGVDYAWIYRNDNWHAPLDHVVANAQPGDALMTNGTSLIARHYDGNLPRLDVFAHWGARETAELLGGLPAEVRRVWYARYPEADPRSIVDVLHRRALLEARETFPDVEMYLYRLVREKPAQLEPAITYAEPGQEPLLRLRSFAVADEELSWGRDNLILLGWETPGRADHDLSVRLRLLGADGYVWAEATEPILDGVLQPTSNWEPGGTATAGYRLTPPAGMAPGLYSLEVEVLVDGGQGSLVPLSPGSPAQLPVRVGEPARAVRLDDLEIGQRLDRRLGALNLVGVTLQAEVAEAGASLPLSLIWEMTQAPPGDLQLRLELRGLDGDWILGTAQSVLAQGYWVLQSPIPNLQYPIPGALIRTGHNLMVDPSASGGAAWLFAILADPSGEHEVAVTPVPVIAPTPRFELPDRVQHPRAERLGDEVRLLGYDASGSTLSPGATLALTLYWQAGGPVSPPQKVFVHLVGPDGQIHGQRDNQPLLARRPTDGWQPGEVLADPYLVQVEPTAPPGDYVLTIGMYDPASGARLPAFDAKGERLPEDRIVLGQVQVH